MYEQSTIATCTTHAHTHALHACSHARRHSTAQVGSTAGLAPGQWVSVAMGDPSVIVELLTDLNRGAYEVCKDARCAATRSFRCGRTHVHTRMHAFMRSTYRWCRSTRAGWCVGKGWVGGHHV